MFPEFLVTLTLTKPYVIVPEWVWNSDDLQSHQGDFQRRPEVGQQAFLFLYVLHSTQKCKVSAKLSYSLKWDLHVFFDHKAGLGPIIMLRIQQSTEKWALKMTHQDRCNFVMSQQINHCYPTPRVEICLYCVLLLKTTNASYGSTLQIKLKKA